MPLIVTYICAKRLRLKGRVPGQKSASSIVDDP